MPIKILQSHSDFTVFDDFVDDLDTVYAQVQALNAAGNFQKDTEHVLGGVYSYNPPLLMKLQARLFLHLKENGFLNEMNPTYCFVRQYLPGSSLPVHKDRDQCEVNVSLIIRGEEKFSLKSADGIVHEIKLRPNQAILYSGKTTEHWRDKINDYLCVALFHFMKT